MAAPRKYSDAQRQAVYRMFEAGKPATEIADLCRHGKAGVEAFEIPRRTVSQITAEMASVYEQSHPTTIADDDLTEAVEGLPTRILRIVETELERIEKKQIRGAPLTINDLDRLKKAGALTTDLTKRIAQGKRTRKAAPKAADDPPRETTVERIAREERERSSGDEVRPSGAHSHQTPPESSAAASPSGQDGQAGVNPGTEPSDTASRQAARAAEIARRSQVVPA